MAWKEVDALRRNAALLQEIGDGAERAAREAGALVHYRKARIRLVEKRGGKVRRNR
jgi:hypothetical protein